MIKTQLSPLPTPSPSISPSSTRSPSPPTGQIKYLLTNFNFKNFQFQPSCLLLPSLPAFPLFPTLNFLLSPPFSLPTDIYLKLELSTPFYKVAPTKTQSPQNLFGTISDDSRKPLPVSCDFHFEYN